MRHILVLASLSLIVACVVIDANVRLSSTRIGELTGTITEIWRVPGIEGDARLEQTIVCTTRSESRGSCSTFGTTAAC